MAGSNEDKSVFIATVSSSSRVCADADPHAVSSRQQNRTVPRESHDGMSELLGFVAVVRLTVATVDTPVNQKLTESSIELFRFQSALTLVESCPEWSRQRRT